MKLGDSDLGQMIRKAFRVFLMSIGVSTPTKSLTKKPAPAPGPDAGKQP